MSISPESRSDLGICIKSSRRVRDRCSACPWLDMEAMEREFPDVVEHARTDPTGFVCHTRCGPCDGPVVALRKELAQCTPTE